MINVTHRIGSKASQVDEATYFIKRGGHSSIVFNDSFLQQGFKLYKQRTDKSFSLTDCISMNVMSNFNLSDVLTHDRHFYQAGFTLLMALR